MGVKSGRREQYVRMFVGCFSSGHAGDLGLGDKEVWASK